MKPLFILLVFLFQLHTLHAQPTVTFQAIIPSGLSRPVDVVHANDGTNRLFIVEQTGTVRIWTGTALLSTPFLDVTSLIISSGSEQGLLSLAFHPNYSTNRYFFIYYTEASTGNIVVRRYQTSTTNPNLADPSTGVTLFSISKKFANHNGGKLLFGPDGYLYFGTGDGGSGGDPDNNAQNGLSLLGKLIRVDVNGSLNTAPYYTIPPTNPFIGNTSYRPEIVAVGLRNPWRYSFDRRTGNLWLADVGQDAWEEVNVVTGNNIIGANYGWSCMEATHFYKANCGATGTPTYIPPIFEYPHSNTTGGFSISGGAVYRGLEFASLQGYYLCADYVLGNGWLIKSNGSGYDATRQTWMTGISSFGEGQDSTLYATRLSGALYKVTLSNPLPIHLTSFTGKATNSFHEINWQVNDEHAGDTYVLEQSASATSGYKEITRRVANASRSTNAYKATVYAATDMYYRLKLISVGANTQYSSVVLLKNEKNKNAIRATVNGGQLDVTLPSDANIISIHDSAGKLLMQQKILNTSGFVSLPLLNAPRGVLIITIGFSNRTEQLKVVH